MINYMPRLKYTGGRAKSRAFFRRLRRKPRTRGPGRGYRVGYNRFGRVSNPELKTKVLTRFRS